MEIEDRRSSRYGSTYFDTTDLDSWAASAHPRRRRWKVRSRLYADSGGCWLEVKTRGARGVTVKERAPYDAAYRDEVRSEAVPWVRERLTAAGVTGVDPGGLVATLRTGYLRTTLLLPGGAGRATIDAHLTWTSPFGHASAGGVLVVETKSPPGGAGPLDRRLWQLGHRPVRISKYGTGLALLTPDLPGNRWHRVTTRHLATTLRITQGAAA
nr:VTC domain-containing protein [Nocardioides sp. IC4_145]